MHPASVVLPEPDSPTTATHRIAGNLERHIVHNLGGAVPRTQSFDPQNRVAVEPNRANTRSALRPDRILAGPVTTHRSPVEHLSRGRRSDAVVAAQRTARRERAPLRPSTGLGRLALDP